MASRCRKAEPSDVPALMRLVRAYYAFDGLRFEEERQRRALTVLLGDPALGGAWLICDGDETAGYFVMTFGFDLEFGGRVALVTELYVQEVYRRKGLGRMALALAEKTARDRGAHALELQASRKNEAALAFYASTGFERHDRIPLSKSVLSLDDLRLVRIEEDGSVAGLSAEALAMEPLAEVVAMTVAVYGQEGFIPPWLGWLALADETAVGTCAFKSPPKGGEVEIGYFTFSAFEGRGVGTWMATRLLELAREHEAEPEVFAQTLPRESASTAILRNTGFVNRGALLHPDDGLVWEWRLRKY